MESIINISSIIGENGFSGLAAYAATKAGMLGMTRALARELGPRNIRVNAVAPGYLETELSSTLTPQQRNQIVRRTPLGRLGRVEDVAPAIEFLLSPAAAFRNRSNIDHRRRGNRLTDVRSDYYRRRRLLPGITPLPAAVLSCWLGEIERFFVEQSTRLSNHSKSPEPILGDPKNMLPQQNDRFLLGIGQVEPRRRIVEVLKSRGARFLTLIHPTAHVDSTATLGEGCIVYPFATIMNNVQIGNFVMLNLYSSAGHDTQIGDYCTFSPYATMNGFSVLEEEVFLGTHSSCWQTTASAVDPKSARNSVVTQDVQPRHFSVRSAGTAYTNS